LLASVPRHVICFLRGTMANNPAPSELLETRKASRISAKMGTGILLLLMAGLFGIAAFVFIWFGFFPGLVMLLVCLPLGALGTHLLRKAKPTNTA
jgi:hypothetical protein